MDPVQSRALGKILSASVFVSGFHVFLFFSFLFPEVILFDAVSVHFVIQVEELRFSQTRQEVPVNAGLGENSAFNTWKSKGSLFQATVTNSFKLFQISFLPRWILEGFCHQHRCPWLYLATSLTTVPRITTALLSRVTTLKLRLCGFVCMLTFAAVRHSPHSPLPWQLMPNIRSQLWAQSLQLTLPDCRVWG